MFTAHLSAIQELLGETGTLIVPTHSWSLCNTSKVFDIKRTPSETGPFTEYIRKQKSSVRQLHPFSSSTALGKEAMAICANTSKHAKRIGLEEAKVLFDIEQVGNTVSSSIPLLLEKKMLDSADNIFVLSGFGVGLSWANCLCRRTERNND
ncbi:MAG: AAC(3) family N-acetyltransferase [Candidatus Electrothrix sp. Rat3]|nr:AAC(3) family N-acetyltransferase [Candidatus Electrothrix rattekaaiensis]